MDPRHRWCAGAEVEVRAVTLGDHDEILNEIVGMHLAEERFGILGADTTRGAAPESVVHVATKSEAIRVVRERVTQKSTILVKGSRGMEMEDVVAGLQD